jgi:methionine-rich copper-binding protein CopC
MKLGSIISMVMAATLLIVLAIAPAAFAEPEVIAATPADGAVLAEPPEVLNLCFSEPVQTEGGAWQFTVSPNGSSALGLRITFADDGSCVDVIPGSPNPAPQGIWQFDWMVKAQSDSAEASGTLSFQVGALQPGQTPLPAPRASIESDDSSTSVVLILLIVLGVFIVLFGIFGFVLRRLRA